MQTILNNNIDNLTGIFAQLRGPFNNAENILPKSFTVSSISIHLADIAPLCMNAEKKQMVILNGKEFVIGETGILELDFNTLFLNDIQKLESFEFEVAQPSGTLVELWF